MLYQFSCLTSRLTTIRLLDEISHHQIISEDDLFCKELHALGPDRTFWINFHSRSINFSRNLPNIALLDARTIAFDETQNIWRSFEGGHFFWRVSPLRRGPGRAPPLRRGRSRAHTGPYGPYKSTLAPYWAHMGPRGARIRPPKEVFGDMAWKRFVFSNCSSHGRPYCSIFLSKFRFQNWIKFSLCTPVSGDSELKSIVKDPCGQISNHFLQKQYSQDPTMLSNNCPVRQNYAWRKNRNSSLFLLRLFTLAFSV